MAKRNEGTGGDGEYRYRLVLAGVGNLETLIEADVRHKFSILGLDSVLELRFQKGNWQFTGLLELVLPPTRLMLSFHDMQGK